MPPIKQIRPFLLLINSAFVLAGPAFAAVESSGPDSVAGKEQLKSRFLKQMKADAARENLGLAYWIELNRQGHLYRTSSLAKFQSGDQIRFHVLSNADGYAYIVMHKGTTGTRSVLFPPAQTSVDNFIKSGSECVVPQEGSLEFDRVPGTEEVGLLLSRSQIDPVAFLSSAASGNKAALPVAKAPEVKAPADDQPSDLEKSFDAIFSANATAKSTTTSSANLAGSANAGALEVLSSQHGVVVAESADTVLASPSTSLALSDDPNAVVSVDFALKHD